MLRVDGGWRQWKTRLHLGLPVPVTYGLFNVSDPLGLLDGTRKKNRKNFRKMESCPDVVMPYPNVVREGTLPAIVSS
jgi:hypothetical protein